MADPDFRDLARRPVRYWNIDGLPELFAGVLWMIWGGAWLVGENIPHDWRFSVYWVVVPAFFAGLGFVQNAIVRRVKERVTFPRAGYVAWKVPTRARFAAVAAAVVIGAVLLAMAVVTGAAVPFEHRAPAVITGILSLSFLAIGVRQHTPRHIVLAATVVVLALAIGARTSGWTWFNWTLVAFGAACAAVGIGRLVVFLRAYPRQAEGL